LLADLKTFPELVNNYLEIMEARQEQATPDADIEHSQPRLGDGGVFPQKDAQADHDSHEGIAGPLLECEDADFLAGDGLDAVDITAGKAGKTVPEDQEGQYQATRDQ
jgi:hypothetical protein